MIKAVRRCPDVGNVRVHDAVGGVGSREAQCESARCRCNAKVKLSTACAEYHLRTVPAACAFTLRLSRTYPHAAPSTQTLLTSGQLRTAYTISGFTLAET